MVTISRSLPLRGRRRFLVEGAFLDGRALLLRDARHGRARFCMSVRCLKCVNPAMQSPIPWLSERPAQPRQPEIQRPRLRSWELQS
jgi:hypothetical protein